jgi:hypothetical protein
MVPPQYCDRRPKDTFTYQTVPQLVHDPSQETISPQDLNCSGSKLTDGKWEMFCILPGMGNYVSVTKTHIYISILHFRTELATNWTTVQAYLEDIAGSVPDHRNKASDTNFFWFLSAYKSYAYIIL